MSDNQNNGPDMGGNNNSQPNNEQQYTNQQNQQQYQQNQQQYQQPPFQNNQQQYQQQYQQPFNGQVPPPIYGQKSKVAAGILGIMLGYLGVHNFYLGFTGKAVAQLLITVLTCGAGGVISGIWGLIEGIMILTGSIAYDANGVPLGQ